MHRNGKCTLGPPILNRAFVEPHHPWHCRSKAEADHQFGLHCDAAELANDQAHDARARLMSGHEIDERAFGALKTRLQDQRVGPISASDPGLPVLWGNQPAAMFQRTEESRETGVRIKPCAIQFAARFICLWHRPTPSLLRAGLRRRRIPELQPLRPAGKARPEMGRVARRRAARTRRRHDRNRASSLQPPARLGSGHPDGGRCQAPVRQAPRHPRFALPDAGREGGSAQADHGRTDASSCYDERKRTIPPLHGISSRACHRDIEQAAFP